MKEKHIVSFSGGKDSTAMLLMMIEKGMQIDEIIFVDTGVEFPQMYEHIQQVEKHIGRKITKIKDDKSFEYYMLEHVKTRGKNKGQKGYSWSDFKNRWCTKHLKQQPFKKYLKKYKGFKIIEYHGIAFDELERVNKNNNKEIKYPLVEYRITEKQALEYCYDKGFTWSGLYSKFERLSCYLCPLQRIKELRTLYNEFPELWEHMKELDSKTYRKFRSDYSIKELEEKFKKELINKKLF